MEYSNTLNDEKLSPIKAQIGIENIEELYRQIQESEQADDEEGEGGEEGGDSNGEEQ